MLDLRLQEIKERVGIRFGGISVIVFGDMMQLKPCLGRYISDEPLNQDFKATYHLNSRWEMFDCVVLEKNHRQGRDKSYADLLNRLRTADQTDDDIKLLRTRIRPAGHPDVDNANMYIGCKRNDVALINEKYIKKIKGKAYLLKARHHHEGQEKYKPFIDKKDGGVGSTALQNEIIVKIGAKIMIVHNIDVADLLTNGQRGELVDVLLSKDGQPDKLVIKLVDKNAGKENQSKYSEILREYDSCIIVERVSIKYTIRKKGGTIGSYAKVFQFPVRLAYATTSHKIQGQSLLHPLTVVLNIDSVFEPGQAYVMFSRVQCIDQVFILGQLDPDKLRASRLARNELERLNNISMNKNPTPWHQTNHQVHKRIASLNCAGLLPHLKDLKVDPKLKEADLIALQETSLDPEHTIPSIDGFLMKVAGRGKGKGIAMLHKDDLDWEVTKSAENNLQIMRSSSQNLDVINVYRSQSKSLGETANLIIEKIDTKKPTLIIGDMNVCVKRNKNNAITQSLANLGFVQLTKEATHIEGNHIDHVYWKDVGETWEDPTIERYSPYFSDHDAHLISFKLVSKETIFN